MRRHIVSRRKLPNLALTLDLFFCLLQHNFNQKMLLRHVAKITNFHTPEFQQLTKVSTFIGFL